MTETNDAGERLEVRSSRLWALFHFNLTRLLFPLRMAADRLGVSTSDVKFWLTPWQRTDEHLPLSHIAEVTHTRGFFWDAVERRELGRRQSVMDYRGVEIFGALFRRSRARAIERVHSDAAAAALNPSPPR